VSTPRLKIRCPNCRAEGGAQPELINRRVSCRHCAFIFRVVPVEEPGPVEATVLVNSAAGPPGDRVKGLEREVRKLRRELAEGRPARALQAKLDHVLDALGKAEAREKGLRDEVARLHDQLDQSLPDGTVSPRDALRDEELLFLRDQLDRARLEVEQESRRRRESASALNARAIEHARAIEEKDDELARIFQEKEAEHAEALRAAAAEVEEADRRRDEALAILERALADLEALRARPDAGDPPSVDWGEAGTELEVPKTDAPTEAEITSLRPRIKSTVFDGGPD